MVSLMLPTYQPPEIITKIIIFLFSTVCQIVSAVSLIGILWTLFFTKMGLLTNPVAIFAMTWVLGASTAPIGKTTP